MTNNNKRSSLQRSARKLEDLVLMMNLIKPNELREILDIVYELEKSQVGGLGKLSRYADINKNRNLMVGILPRFFQDTNIFAENRDIAEFSQKVLGFTLKRYEKKSKFELIGIIVCAVNELSDKELEDVVSYLSNIIESDIKIKQLAEEKSKSDFSWNDAIKKLGGTE